MKEDLICLTDETQEGLRSQIDSKLKKGWELRIIDPVDNGLYRACMSKWHRDITLGMARNPITGEWEEATDEDYD